MILDAIQNKSANGTAIAWTTAVPGASVNWTSIDDVRRRKNPDVFKTGKKNPNQVSAVGGFFQSLCESCPWRLCTFIQLMAGSAA